MIYKIKETITLEEIASIINNDAKLSLSAKSLEKIQKCRAYLDQFNSHTGAPVYGVNTGFGSLCDTVISSDNLEKLQENLLLSHACGTGNEVPEEIIELMILLKVQSLSYGHSGVHHETVERLIDFYNLGIFPVVYEQGSLGASGDLAPLAHLCLPLIGKGHVWVNGNKQEAHKALNHFGLKPVSLHSKSGLALINGTQFMSAYGVYCLLQARNLVRWFDITAAISLDAFLCRKDPFDARIAQLRPHSGHSETSKTILDLLKGSEIFESAKTQVQDPYSFRCIPQVHGASKDALKHVESIFLTEINSVTDNPNVFPDDDVIISGGNFHGQPLALALDYFAIAMAELASISERRTYQLISGQRSLPAFLSPEPGLNSGFMIPQYTAASIVSQNKQLCHPASVDSIVSSNGQEDHVSMGANAATKALRVTQNCERVLAIELLNAAQALEFRRPLKSSPKIEKLMEAYRKSVPFLRNDSYLHEHINQTIHFIRTYNF